MIPINKKKKFVIPEFTVMKIEVEGFCAASMKVKSSKIEKGQIEHWSNKDDYNNDNKITGDGWL